MPKEKRPRRRRTKATRNWVPLPTVGRKGFPAAACQTSMSFESMDPDGAIVLEKVGQLVN